VWVPSYIGIAGITAADAVAKASVNLQQIRFTISRTLFIGVFEFSYDVNNLQLSLLDPLTVQPAFAQTIFLDSKV
jgi:hypothetical protein